MMNQLNINKMKNLNSKTMSRIAFTLLMLLTLSLNAQVSFKGIPVDGDVPEMMNQLRKIGFKDTDQEYSIEGYTLPVLEGYFNGKQVNVFVNAYNGKVYRITVCDANTVSEAQIIINYNRLFDQFVGNSKYTLDHGEKIRDNEDVYYNMEIRNYVYEASFIQNMQNNSVWFRIVEVNSEFYIGIIYDNLLNAPNGDDL